MSISSLSRTALTAAIKNILLPGADASRTRAVDRTLNKLPEESLRSVLRAAEIAKATRKVTVVRDAVESRDLLSIAAIEKWGKVLCVSEVERGVGEYFCAATDLSYDVYSDTFQAHVEAYATYHDHCVGDCQPFDIAMDYDVVAEAGMAVPPHGHYLDYLQDYDLMDAVEKHPEHVGTLVRLFAERRGMDEEQVDEYLSAPAASLASGLL